MRSSIHPTLVCGVALFALACNREPEPAATATNAPQTATESPETTSAPPQTRPLMQALRDGCPVADANVDVTIADEDDGIALTFTTESGSVDDLRARVKLMADRYANCDGQRMRWHRVQGGDGPGPQRRAMGPGSGMGHMGMHGSLGQMPDAMSSVENVDRGARLKLVPTDPSTLDALRQHVRQHHERMQSGECWMVDAEHE